ncbi:class I SAM-dependent methyltransferase [soil metagenome]
MQTKENIIDCYNKTAKNYADKFIDELSHKHFDSFLLKAFAVENQDNGKLIDLGCGPGQTTKYLYDCGITNIVGTDISPGMIAVAKNINPQPDFDIADMLSLKYPDQSFGAAIAFYSIVHFDYEQVSIALKEIKRVLKNNGHFLFSFHIGDNILHLDNFLEQQVNVDFYFFETNKIKELLSATGFEIIDIIERQQYADIEYESRRVYIWVKKPNS